MGRVLVLYDSATGNTDKMAGYVAEGAAKVPGTNDFVPGGSSIMSKNYTWQEIVSQPRVWAATLEAFSRDQVALRTFLDQAEFDQICVVGCGSTHYLSQAAAATLTQRGGIPARGCPSSELWLFPGTLPTGRSGLRVRRSGLRVRRTLLVAVSRSGSTTETLYALERFQKSIAGPTLAVTCYPESPLAQQADFVLVAPEGQEQSVAQTRSFTSMLLLTQALAATLAGDEGMLERLNSLPNALTDLMNRLGDLPRRLAADREIERIFFLGGGPLYGIANEAMLKTKEMSLSYAEAYHPLEFRHGPMSMVNDRTLVVGLVSDSALAEEINVLADMQGLGARVLALIDDASVLDTWQPHYVAELRSGLDEWERQPLYLPVLQRLAYHRAVAKGLDPDRPTHLEAVVTL